MEAAQRSELEALMRRMAEGDRAAIFTFHERFGARIAVVVRRHLRSLGVPAPSVDDVDELVIDACLDLADLAPSWRPDGGALPWHWADRRILARVSRWVGIHADELPDGYGEILEFRPPVELAEDACPLTLLASMAEQDPDCALLLDALNRVTTERNRRILIDVRLQASLGDPSPAVTVGRIHGMTPAAVRQVVKRTKDRLDRLAIAEPRFAPLADFALLA